MKKLTPPTLMLFCLLSMILLSWILPFPFVSNWILFSFGLGFILLGLVMSIGAEAQFRRSQTTVDHRGTASKLVTAGWFSFSRNPMYLSFVLMLIGALLTLGSIASVLVILVYIFLAEQWYIFSEEKRLKATFGGPYESYKQRTRRWL